SPLVQLLAGATTSRHGNRPASPDQEITHHEDERRDQHVLDVLEPVMEAVPARAEPPADPGEEEAPREAADRGQHDVAPEGRLEAPRRNGDEGPHHGRHPAEQHRLVLPALEPLLGPVELLLVQVYELAVLLEERPAAVEADRPAADRSDQVAERAGE